MQSKTAGELFGEWWDSANDTDRLECVLKSHDVQRDLIEDNAERINELKIKIGMQQGLFNAAMDRCEKAETRVMELEEKSGIYREALEHIVKHVEITAGGMAPVSGVYVIATKALTR